jgi:HSP20 family protein
MILRRIYDWPDWDLKNSFEDLERMRRQMDRLYEGFRGGAWREPDAGVFPLTNVTEDKDFFYVRAELPGVKADDLEISVTNNSVSISGERRISENQNVKYYRQEREAGRFSRMISLPTPIDTSKAEAHSSDGILTITIPKAEAAKPRQISIKAS